VTCHRFATSATRPAAACTQSENVSASYNALRLRLSAARGATVSNTK
jgi:hypothetical protein